MASTKSILKKPVPVPEPKLRNENEAIVEVDDDEPLEQDGGGEKKSESKIFFIRLIFSVLKDKSRKFKTYFNSLNFLFLFIKYCHNKLLL